VCVCVCVRSMTYAQREVKELKEIFYDTLELEAILVNL
jgi:hypothetical protein